MDKMYGEFWNTNKKRMFTIIFSLLFAYTLTYIITLPLFLPDNDVQKEFFKFAFPFIFIISSIISYGLYFIYAYIVISLIRKSGSLRIFYGPLLSSLIGSVITLLLYFKSRSIMSLVGTIGSDGVAHTFSYYRRLALDLNWNYLPELLISMFILIVFVDLIFVSLKFKSEKLKWMISVLFGGIVLFFLTVLIALTIFILQIIFGIFYGGFNPA